MSLQEQLVLLALLLRLVSLALLLRLVLLALLLWQVSLALLLRLVSLALLLRLVLLTLVDARNGFNELSRYAMLWTARHRWPKGAQFVFNCYRQYARCLLCNPGSEPSILLSREGVTQGCPQSGILYGLGLLPLAELLRRNTNSRQPTASLAEW